MIPATLRDVSQLDRRFHRRPAVWKSFQKPVVNYRLWREHGQHATRTASPDELCAASVLLTLSPKDTSYSNDNAVHKLDKPIQGINGRLSAMPQSAFPPPIISVPPLHGKPLGTYYREVTSLEHVPKTSACHVSDHSVVEDSVGSNGSIVEDSTFCDEASTSSSRLESHSMDKCWVAGSVSLSLDDDTDVLSPLHCFMRRYCVEAFSATPEDISTPRYGKSHGVKVVVGQVGIRCLYCKSCPSGRRPERAVCYPSSLKNIYHSIETWQRRHSLVCSDIPPWVRKSILELMESSKSRAGGRRQYWEDSARRLGMVDTNGTNANMQVRRRRSHRREKQDQEYHDWFAWITM